MRDCEMADLSFIPSALLSVQETVDGITRELNLPKPPRLVAISKTKPNSYIMSAYESGHRCFGENYVQELVNKANELPSDIQWHFVGHLQSNKCKLIAGIPNLTMVETVDSVKIAQYLDKACAQHGRARLNVLVQVNTSGETAKSGTDPSNVCELARYIVDTCPRLALSGLMTIGAPGDMGCFDVLAQCKRQVVEAVPQAAELDRAGVFELSMGMSADYAEAIRRGSTNVRVGSTIFGARAYASSG
eukprot:gnl/Trimastix_PCT/4572.p1 GENE.gnl/Trimastix_PCT/4572~~gnl/Trimastix_PCT/4572.p1  ORF type:complete len:246 (-),score=15.33 gnl/Trimastix_PCT/4572:39-776(-)